MDWRDIEAQWPSCGDRAQERWGKLTDDDLHTIAGRRMKLIGRVQRRYRLSFRLARDQVEGWQAALTASAS